MKKKKTNLLGTVALLGGLAFGAQAQNSENYTTANVKEKTPIVVITDTSTLGQLDNLRTEIGASTTEYETQIVNKVSEKSKMKNKILDAIDSVSNETFFGEGNLVNPKPFLLYKISSKANDSTIANYFSSNGNLPGFLNTMRSLYAIAGKDSVIALSDVTMLKYMKDNLSHDVQDIDKFDNELFGSQGPVKEWLRSLLISKYLKSICNNISSNHDTLDDIVTVDKAIKLSEKESNSGYLADVNYNKTKVKVYNALINLLNQKKPITKNNPITKNDQSFFEQLFGIGLKAPYNFGIGPTLQYNQFSDGNVPPFERIIQGGGLIQFYNIGNSGISVAAGLRGGSTAIQNIERIDDRIPKSPNGTIINMVKDTVVDPITGQTRIVTHPPSGVPVDTINDNGTEAFFGIPIVFNYKGAQIEIVPQFRSTKWKISENASYFDLPMALGWVPIEGTSLEMFTPNVLKHPFPVGPQVGYGKIIPLSDNVGLYVMGKASYDIVNKSCGANANAMFLFGKNK